MPKTKTSHTQTKVRTCRDTINAGTASRFFSQENGKCPYQTRNKEGRGGHGKIALGEQTAWDKKFTVLDGKCRSLFIKNLLRQESASLLQEIYIVRKL
jgi:hypothetical protein